MNRRRMNVCQKASCGRNMSSLIWLCGIKYGKFGIQKWIREQQEPAFYQEKHVGVLNTDSVSSLKDWLAQQVVTMKDAPSGDHHAQQSVEHCLPKAMLECTFHCVSFHPEIPAHLAIDL